jgi:hypothetical protein
MENHQEVEQDIVQVVQPPCSPNMIDFDKKKMLIRSDQTGSARGKNIVIDKNAAPRMIKQKNTEVGVQKVDERKRKSSPRPKPTVKQLLDKYTSRKANNMFSRLRSPSHPGGHERQRGSSYDQHAYFPMKPTYWSGALPVYPQFLTWGFNHCEPYLTRLAGTSTQQRRYYADDKNYKDDNKQIWVPVKHAKPKTVKASDDLDAAYCLGPGKHEPAEDVLNITETSSAVERKGDGIEKKDLDTTLASLSTSLNDESDSMHTGSAMRDTSSGASMHFQPMVFKNSASIFTQHEDSSNRDS